MADRRGPVVYPGGGGTRRGDGSDQPVPAAAPATAVETLTTPCNAGRGVAGRVGDAAGGRWPPSRGQPIGRGGRQVRQP